MSEEKTVDLNDLENSEMDAEEQSSHKMTMKRSKERMSPMSRTVSTMKIQSKKV